MAERTFGSYPQVMGMQGGGDKEDEIKRRVEEILRWDRLRGKKNACQTIFATHFVLSTCLTIIHVMYGNILSLISSVYIFNCLQIWVRKYFLKPYNFKECSWNAFGNVNKLTWPWTVNVCWFRPMFLGHVHHGLCPLAELQDEWSIHDVER